MNKNHYRLVFSRVRGMLVAVEETASASGNAGRGEVVSTARVPHAHARFARHQVALAALVVVGAMPMWTNAQIVGGGAHSPSVIQTQNVFRRSTSIARDRRAYR